ncbi:type 1 glutamine amidotransferase-like domain-containing protein [Bacillus sp. RO3]|nr:type 1 glutamine amidotransferase-like domain-containing protein [Bacillus sp. RO3]
MSGLYLSGGGDKEQTKEIDRMFAGELDGGKSLLYLPIAMNSDAISYEECYKWIQDVFDPFGVRDIIMWEDLRGKTLDDLMAFSAVYIGGGNTFRLMYDILQNDFHTKLIRFIDEGGSIYGGSAGAIIAGSNIGTCLHMDENQAGLKTLKGLCLMEDFAIWCHYEEENDDLIRSFIKSYDKPVIALSEETGLYIKSGSIVVLGAKPAIVFDDDSMKPIEPGGII